MPDNKIKAIGFDYGGVVGVSKSVMPEISELINIPLQQIKEVYFQHNQLANVGGLSYKELWEKILVLIGKSEFTPQVIQIVSKYDKPDLNLDVVNLIEELREKGFKVGMLSNNIKEIANRMRQEGIAEMFDTFLISAEIGYQKPDKEAFEVLFKELDVKAEECVYIDDSPNSLRKADQIGYTPILFKNYKQLRSELINLKVLEK